MNIGDKVRFLSDVGGGIIVGFDAKGWALVEDEDGFEVPMPKKECVVVEESVVGKKSTVTEQKYIQTRDGDSLNIALVYTKSKEPYAGAQTYLCTLVNESNYNLMFSYCALSRGVKQLVYAGEVLPFQKKVLFSFGKEALSDGSKKVQVSGIFFKRGDGNTSSGYLNEGEYNIFKGFETKKSWSAKDSIEKEFVLDPVNLLKEGSFKENEYLSGRGYVIKLIKEGDLNHDELTQYKRELYEKFSLEIPNKEEDIKSKKPRSYKSFMGSDPTLYEGDDPLVKVNTQGVLEVDLHADQLLETKVGMDNGAILRYQLETFNKVMKAHIKDRGTKIVFIHGKGDGVLRNALVSELKTKYSGTSWQDASFKEYGFGATMVRL